MPLIKCDECGRKISDQSRFCPRCGHPTHLNKGYRDLHTDVEPEREETPEEVQEQLELAREEDEIAVNVDDLDRAAILAENRRKNDRMKNWIFIAVTVAVLGLIVVVYLLTPKDTGIKETVMDEEMTETATLPAPDIDTVPQTEAPKAVEKAAPAKATTTPVEKPAAKPKPAEKPAAEPSPAPQPREVTVAPLSEQAAPAPAPTPTPPAPNE